MPQFAKHLPAIYVILVCIAARISLYETSEIISEDVLENDWFTFQCDYEPTKDRKSYNELAVNVGECTKPPTMVMTPSDFNLVAAVFGGLTAESDEMKARFRNSIAYPVYYGNIDNEYVKSGLVQITNGSRNSITIKIRATPRTDRICAFCSQTMASFGYSIVKTVSLKIRSLPTVSLTLNDAPVQQNERRDVELNQTVSIACRADGPDTISVKLFRKNEEINSARAKNVTYKIDRISRDNAGVYKCEATTDLQFLVDKNVNVVSTELVLAVKFAPQFDVSEVVRYTKLLSAENIKISVSAYPPAELKCKWGEEENVGQRESFEDKEFVSTYQLILSNLDRVQKQTEFDCTASNEVGERKLRILLTAKAPTPQILSSGETTWHNSYQLRWQHDEKADIDYYQVEIVYKVNGEDVNRTMTKFDPKAQKGAMALVDGKQVSGQTVHSGVLFGLNEGSQHNIRLQSCNQHGCSDFSSPISVQTPMKSAKSFNDPENPEKKQDARGGSSVSLRASIVSVAAASVFCASLLRQKLY